MSKKIIRVDVGNKMLMKCLKGDMEETAGSKYSGILK